MFTLDQMLPWMHRGAEFGGAGYIAGEPNPDPEGIDGLLTVDDVPGARQISYFEEKTNRLIAQNWSNPDGTYRLDGVSPDIEIMIVAKDWSRTWAHVIQGGIKPTPYS